MNFIKYCMKHNYGHIPSALSQLYYLDEIFKNEYVKRDDNIVIGKPFGSAAYYYLWVKYRWLNEITFSAGVKSWEIPFVDFHEETLGNSLGVAAGMAIANGKKTWVNLSDSQLGMGSIYEAIQFIGKHKLDITLTVDFNGTQLTDDLPFTHWDMEQLFANAGWFTYPEYNLKHAFRDQGPNVVLIPTIKGLGVKEMEYDEDGYWHYRTITEEEYPELTLTDKLLRI